MNRRIATWLLILIVLVGGVMRFHDLMKPSYEDGHRGSCTALFALMARNHLRYHVSTTGLVGILNPGRVSKEHFQYYAHHPQGCIILATIGASLGGTRSESLRLMFFPFSVGIILLIYRLGRTRGRFAALAAAGIAATTPIAVYYGAFVNFEIPTIFFTLLSLHLLLRYRRRGRGRDLARGILCFGAAVYCDWIALGLPFCLAVLSFFAEDRGDPLRRKKWRSALFMLFGMAATVLILFQLQVYLQVSRGGTAADHSLPYYLTVTPLAHNFSWSAWASNLSTYMSGLYGWPLVLLSFLGLIPMLGRTMRRQLNHFDVAALCTLTIGIANIVLLANHAKGHDYYLLYLLPALSLLAANLFQMIRGRIKKPTPGRLALSFALLITLVACLGIQSDRLIKKRLTYDLAELGQNIHRVTDSEDVVIYAADYVTLQPTVEADRYVDYADDPIQLETVKKRAAAMGMQGRPIVLLVPRSGMDQLSPEFLAFLEATSEGKPKVRDSFLLYRLGKVPSDK